MSQRQTDDNISAEPDDISLDDSAAGESDPGDSANLSADLSDVDPDEEAACNEREDAGAADWTAHADEEEEVLPLEFLLDPESLSSVLPRGGYEDDSNAFASETVIMSPSEVRRMAARGGMRGGSTRRASASGGATRRSRRDDVENLSPEELAARRFNDLMAKLLIYAIIGVATLAFAGLLTYKLPGIFPDAFPDGIWPWNKILSVYTGE